MSSFELIYLGSVLAIAAVGMLCNAVKATVEKRGLRR